MTTNYRRGADFERKVRDWYYERGASLVVRAAGSHTPVDLVVLYADGEVDLVQCKRDGKLSKAEADKAYAYDAIVWHKLVMAYLEDGKVRTRRVETDRTPQVC